MKTLLTAVLFAAIACTGLARADEPVKTATPTPAKPAAVKKLTTDFLGEMLDRMGYGPQARKDKDGKVIGYDIELTRGATKLKVYLKVSSSGTNLWIDTNMIVLDGKNPPTTEMLLAFLATHDQLWPAYLVYYPNTKLVQMAMSVDANGFGPPVLREKLESMMDKFLIVLDAYKKVKATEQKATEIGKPDANPLP